MSPFDPPIPEVRAPAVETSLSSKGPEGQGAKQRSEAKDGPGYLVSVSERRRNRIFMLHGSRSHRELHPRRELRADADKLL